MEGLAFPGGIGAVVGVPPTLAALVVPPTLAAFVGTAVNAPGGGGPACGAGGLADKTPCGGSIGGGLKLAGVHCGTGGKAGAAGGTGAANSPAWRI